MQTQQLNVAEKTRSEGYLIHISPNHRETFEVGHFIVLGRSPYSQIQISDPFTSERHARIEKKQNYFVLRDLQSANGTYLNGVSIVEAKLKDQDVVKIGQSEFIFSYLRDSKSSALKRTSKNEAWNTQLQRLPFLAQSQLPVLIGGPSGSGKEVISQSIHRLSQRSQGAFVSINCSALNDTLVESELFGHIQGSFTGASKDRKGAFETARGGTLFLDEIGDLPLSLQPKLLRALENQEIKPVGSDRSIHTDVRIISATHQNLKKLVKSGRFREDLFYRLNVIGIKAPALNERLEDFEDLLFFFAKESRVKFSSVAIAKMKCYSWPGNIRELKNTVSRASALFPNQEISQLDLPYLIENFEEENQTKSQIKELQLPMIKQMEKEIIIKALVAHNGNQRQAAAELGMAKSTLHDRIKSFNIDAKSYKRSYY